MNYFIDSSAWVEYLEGSLKGERVHKILQNRDKKYSLNLVISEVVSKARRQKKNSEIPYKAIITNSQIIELTPDLAKEAGLFHADMREKMRDFGLIDAIIWVVARKLKARLITCDFHFKDFKNVLFLG